VPEPLADQIAEALEQAEGLYHRLVLVVAPSGNGKTPALQAVSERKGFPLLNVNLELSRRLLDMPEKQRAFAVQDLLGEIVSQAEGHVVLLDNIEILFDASLKLDPLRLLQAVSRNTTLAVAWNGNVQNDALTYAGPGHPEFRRYPALELLVVTPEKPSMTEAMSES